MSTDSLHLGFSLTVNVDVVVVVVKELKMKGRLLVMVKKWWVLVLVMTLAMSLTSCGRKKNTNLLGSNGWTWCSGDMGDFFVITEVAAGRAGFYDVWVEVDAAAADGDLVSIAITQGGYYPQVKQSNVTVYSGAQIYLGQITENDLYSFDTVEIKGVPQNSGGVAYPYQQSAMTECDLPFIGDSGE